MRTMINKIKIYNAVGFELHPVKWTIEIIKNW